MQKIKITAAAKINGLVQKNEIRKADLIKHDLKITLEDQSCNIIGFIASYDCHSRSLFFDINERTYFGNLIKANDNFIRHVWVGDYLCIDCINIEINGKTLSIPGICFQITE